MNKIIKTFEEKSYSICTGLTKDLNLFKVNAIIQSYVSLDDKEEVYSHEIDDIELSYEINGKYCRYVGFKELYEKLYGKDTFKKFESDLVKEFEKAYFKA